MFPMIDQKVYEKAGFHISELKPEESAKECTAPAFFLHGDDDYFIVPEHTDKNYESYAGEDKVLRKCPGDHNSVRPDNIVLEILAFFKKNLLTGKEKPQGASASAKDLQ